MKDEPRIHRLSRRELVRIAGVGGLAVAADVANPFPLSVLADSAQDESPEGFLAWAYAQRAQAMTTGDARVLDTLYDPANGELVSFERDRVRLYHLGFITSVDGAMRSYEATVSLVALNSSGSSVSARLYETLRVTWTPRPQAVPAWAERLRLQEPAKYQSRVPRGPHGEVVSTYGTRHEVVVVKGRTGWRLSRDAYEEVTGASPDLVPGSWAGLQGGGPIGINTPANPGGTSSSGAVASPLTSYTYNYTGAMKYALDHCGTSSYNTGQYCNYNPCGGDCANFVSQCFEAGAEVYDSNWRTFSGACGRCGTTAPKAGTDTWANAAMLRDWVTGSGRGQTVDYWSLGIGDMIYYSSPTGHVAIVVDPPSGSGPAKICSHNPDICEGAYDTGILGSYAKTYVQLYTIYNA